MKPNKHVITRNDIKCNGLKKWTSTKKHYKVQKGEHREGAIMAVLAKPINFTIVIDEDNRHVIDGVMTEERKKKLAELKRKAAMISKNLR